MELCVTFRTAWVGIKHIKRLTLIFDIAYNVDKSAYLIYDKIKSLDLINKWF